MTQTVIDFSSNIIDGTASGSSGDNQLQVGDFVFTITAQGNWTADFSNGRFNFQEDSAVGGENFHIAITSASGAQIGLYDYQISVNGTPATSGNNVASMVLQTGATSTTWADESFSSGGPVYYRAIFAGNVPALTYGNAATIDDIDFSGTSTSATMTFWMDNITFDTIPGVSLTAPSLTVTANSATFVENGSNADLFSSVTAATNDAGQTFAGMVLTVSDFPSGGTSDYITVGGTQISVANGGHGTLSGGGSYSVSSSGSTATITLSGMTLSNSQMATLIDGMSYGVSGDDPGSATRHVAITQITDSGGSHNTAGPFSTASVAVTPVNDAPTGSATAILTHGTEDTIYVVTAAQLLQGFSDADGDTLSVTGLLASGGAIVTDNHDGSYTITPAVNFNGLVTLAYLVIDGNLGAVAASQSIAFDPANDAPTGSATATLAHGTEDIAYTVNASDLVAGFSDADGDTLSVSNLSGSDGATVTDNHDGTYTITPAANFNGAVTLTYTVTDGHAGSAPASQFVTFDPVNDDPTGTATATLAHGTEDTSYTVNASDLLAGFSDIEGDTLSVSNLAAAGATVTDNHDGTYTIVPAADFNGALTLSYSVTDGNGGSTAASQSVTFDATNDAPTGTASATLAHGAEDTSYTVNASDLLAGFSDIDGDTLSVSNLSASAGATVTDNHDGTYTIAPAADFNGAVTLSYSVIDGNGGSKPASQSVTFDAVNDAPAGTATAVLVHGTEDTSYIVNASDLLAGLSDTEGDTLSVSNLSASAGATVTDNHDGTYTIAPAADFNGALTLSYSVVDGNGGSTAASQSVTFDAVNDAPTGTATATLAHGTEDTSYTVNASDLLAGFSDADGDTLSVSNLSASAGATVTDNHDGTYTIAPAADFNGAVTLSYSVIDGNGGSKPASQSVTFDAVNDAPTGTATATLAHGTEDTSYTVNASDLLSGFSDAEGDTLSVSNLSTSAGATVTDNHDGTYTIAPAADFNGAVTLSYSVIDGNGGSKAANQSVTFDAINDAPAGTATATLANGIEDTVYTVAAADLLAGYSDVDGDTLSVTNLIASAGATVIDNHDGTYSIAPAADYNGAVSLSYSVADGHGGTASASQSITFDAINDAPVAADDTGAMNEHTPTAFDVLANDDDVDSRSLSTINPLITSNNGTVSIDQDGHLLVSYTGPALDVGEKAQVVVSYQASDGAATDDATLTVTVTGVYDPGENVEGTNKGETLNGTKESETINGFGGNDTINGRGGDDDISGGFGDDIVRGGKGNDNLHSGAGNDRIIGGAGDDRIVGWGGDDILTGGAGKDVFVFHVNDGNDIITDFDAKGADHDTIDLSAFGQIHDFKDIKALMSQDHQNTVIDFAGDNSITLKHVDMDTLGKDDFLF